MDRDVLMHRMNERFQELCAQALDALERAPEGQWLAASEWAFRQTRHLTCPRRNDTFWPKSIITSDQATLSIIAMQPSDFKEDRFGMLAQGPEGYWAFVPNPLPPRLELSWRLVTRLSDAERTLGELAGRARNLPNPHLLIGPFVRREAVLSSRIEGTRTSLSDLFFFEAADSAHPPPGRTLPEDVREVANYVQALEYGLKRLKDLPLSLRLVRELHERLMRGVRGEHMTPGEFRRSQNRIGPPGCTLMDATYVPPPVPAMHEALGEMEKFLHADSGLPPLIRVACLHYQFEAIHPFLDGNGRVGRLLIPLLLCHHGLLSQPLLYLSAFFDRRRQDYYGLLLAVSQAGAWSDWIEFFLEGVADQARDGVWRTGRLLDLWQVYRQRLQSARSSALLLRLIDDLFESPVTSISAAAGRLSVTHPSATKIIEKLEAAGILREVTRRERHRLYVAQEVIDTIEAPRSE